MLTRGGRTTQNWSCWDLLEDGPASRQANGQVKGPTRGLASGWQTAWGPKNWYSWTESETPEWTTHTSKAQISSSERREWENVTKWSCEINLKNKNTKNILLLSAIKSSYFPIWHPGHTSSLLMFFLHAFKIIIQHKADTRRPAFFLHRVLKKHKDVEYDYN